MPPISATQLAQPTATIPHPTAAGYGLYLDLQITQVPLYIERGTVRYCSDYARALLRRNLVSRVGMNPMMPFPAKLVQDLLAEPRLEWSTATNFRRARLEGPVAYHLMTPFMLSQFDSLVPPFALDPAIPLVMTLTDVFPISHPDEFFMRRDIAGRLQVRSRFIRSADLVLTISEATRLEAIRWIDLDPGKVVSVGTGVSDYFRTPASIDSSLAAVRAALPAITRPFVLCVTGPWPRKNTEKLIEAFAKLPAVVRREHQLVLVCRLNDEYRSRWSEHAKVCGLGSDQVVLTDLVTEPVLRALYQSARLFVYPPLLEGFGLPAAEAAACGCPTLVSNTSSMPEVVGRASATFPPDNTNAIAAAMGRGLVDEDFRVELLEAAAFSAANHTWDNVVDRTEEAMKLLDGPVPAGRKPRGRQRPRLAVVGSLPKTDKDDPRSGEKLVWRLSAMFDLDLFGNTEADTAQTMRGRGVRSFPMGALGRHLNPAGYDALIYTFGLDQVEMAQSAHDAALLFPGVIWLQPSALDVEPARCCISPLILKLARGLMLTRDSQLAALLVQAGPNGPLPPIRVIRKPADVLSFVRSLQAPDNVQEMAPAGYNLPSS